ncbi:MAG TPA: transglycosylase SLT domain-containing protein [Alphaproteobacteria bacterium]|nr:transglycosylase SLT domain-containing protein [Alphaproteobacteria bacterium]
MGVQPIKVPQGLALILDAAGQRSGVDFNYLLQTAMRESALDPAAKARTSSAVGLFQFLESTWLEVMKEEGPRLGYGQYAGAITRTADGDYIVKDKALREEILALREDPRIAADLAAAFTRRNGAYLLGKFGRMPSPGELYIAHFLGAEGAEKLFTAGLTDPDQIAARLFPKQAKANPSIFYALGKPRTIREVYRALVAQHSGAPAIDSNFAAQQLASGQGPGDVPSKWPDAVPVPSRFAPADMSFTTLFSTEAEGAAGPLVSAYAAPEAPGPASEPAGAIRPRVLMSDPDNAAAARMLFNRFAR